MVIMIRSQDRKSLLECRTFDISVNIDSKYKLYGNSFTIGTYSTKEKAIKVLDMIQSHLLNKKLMDLGLATSFQNDDIVFQMPQDDGV